MGRKQLPPSEDPAVEKKRERDRKRRAKKASSSTVDDGVNDKLVVLRAELATALDKPVDEIRQIKYKDGLYDPVDGLMLMSEKNRNHAGEDLRLICVKFPDVHEKLVNIAYDDQGSRPDSKGCDLPTLLEIMMLSPSRNSGTLRRKIVVTFCRVLGGDATLANQILEIRRVQDALRESGQEDHPARAFGRYVEQTSSTDSELSRLQTEQQKRQIELQIEDMERKAKLRREEDERQAELKKQEFMAKKSEQELLHASTMQELTLREDKTRRDHLNYGIEKARQDVHNKATVTKMIEDGHISREEGDRLLGVQRVMLRVPMGKILERIWVGPNVTIKNDLPNNYTKCFYDAYTMHKDEYFPNKPPGDFTNDAQQPPQNIKWYDADLADIWKYAEKLRDDELNKRQGGSRSLFDTRRAARACPSLTECRQKFGI